MSQAIRNGVDKLQQAFDSASTGDKKAQQLAQNTKDVHDPSNRITTDYGVTQSNTGIVTPSLFFLTTCSY